MQLNHSRDPKSLMYYTANNGYIAPASRINLTLPTAAAAVAGAKYSVKHSDSISGDCNGYYSTMVPKYTSCTGTNGIKELKGNNTFEIYPNPSPGTFTIVTNINDYNLVITNILGQQILSQKIQNEKTVIALDNKANGMYFIQEQYKDGIATQKLIIQK